MGASLVPEPVVPEPVGSEPVGSELADVQRRLAQVDAELASVDRTERAIEHREVIRQLRERFELRFASLARAHDAAASLRHFSSQAELLRRAPRALTTGTRFRRAIAAVVQEGALVPVAASFETGGVDEDGAEIAKRVLAQLREQPIRLEHHTVESDVTRRRRATLVANIEVNARVDPRMVALLGWSSYVVAPLLSGATVVGMIHADRGTASLDVLDRDVLSEFAAIISQINESAELRSALRQEREALRRFVDRVTALSVSFADAPFSFPAYVGDESEQPPVLLPTAPNAIDVVQDDRLVMSGLLTRRELEVLRLLAEGSTNRTIANALVLSDTTVKFHVNGILRKLHVANRAEAVARYLSLLGMPSPQ